jgi:hypothetical protein
MSYFSEEATPQANQTEDYLASIAQEKGEQWRDPQVLAKGYATSQEYIAKLETELKASKSEQDKSDYMKEVLAEIQKAQSPSTKELPVNTSGTPNEADQPKVGVEQINELVKKALTDQEADRTAGQNLKVADEELVKQYGTEAEKVVEERRLALGLSKERLAQIAKESPTAFLALIGPAQKRQSNDLSTSSVNTSSDSFNKPGVRDFSYYNDMRKTNPKLYRSAQTQEQMLKDRQAIGADNFY